jgi:hypothetical protein
LGIVANLTGGTDTKETAVEKPKAKVEQVDKKDSEEAKKKAEEAKVRAQIEKTRKEMEAKKKAEEAKAKKLAAEEAINIGMDAITFENNWGALSGDVGGNLLLNNPEFKKGTVKNTKSYTVNQNVGVVATIHKGNGMISEVTLIAMPTKDNNDNAEIILTFALLIGATNTDLAPDERGEIFNGLMDQNPNLEDKDVWYTKGNLKYGLLVSKETGMWLNIKNVDAK